jgi:hypothetical protein
MIVGHDLRSTTSDFNPVIIEFDHDHGESANGRLGHGTSGFTNPNSDNKGRLILVDTPGFDDTYSVDDVEILQRISVWLGMSSVAFRYFRPTC